ncbi:hypothetical protein GGF42_003088 [Coemansia sp. RSA 2424]|nr:hypothetical protein GGF42_003088 [Coemansia sp. RSA 2424]
MDKLMRGIQSQTAALATLDMIPSFVYIAYYFHYGNHANDPHFMPAELLRESFYLTLLDFPLFVGRLEADGSGHAWVVVDKDNLNIPEFLESESSVHFDDIQAAKFSWDALPEAVATASAITTVGTGGAIKSANIHVVRLRDNSGIVLYIGIAHYLVDGAAYSEFVCRWADVCRRLSSGASSAELPSFQTSFSRSTISDHLPDDRRALDDPTRELITTTGLFASPMESLTSGIDAQSLALVAQNVRKLVNDVDPQYIGQYIDTLHKDPSHFMCPVAYALTKTAMLVSNQSRFPLYKADFGSGTPVWVIPIRTFLTNFISILPAPPSAGGYC